MAAQPTSNISFQNFFSATLTSDITAVAVDIPLDNVPNGSEGFLVIDPDSTTGREVIYYNSKTTVKVVCPSAADGRGQDDTTAGPHLQGTTVIMAPVAAYYETLLSLFTTSPQGWTSVAGTVSAVTNNGNRSYDISISTDNTAILSPGMRLRSTRGTNAPTQVTSLNGTTQYWSKSSPAAMTFTDDFVVSAWVKLSSYPSTSAGIISRWNGTSGWILRFETTGQIRLSGYNAGGSNESYVQSYQSVPLNKWVHISAQLDMSAFTATSTTSYIMFDGVDVPCSVARSGTNPTALVQAGNLEVGSYNGGTGLSSVKIAQAFVSSAKITQANIRTLYSQGLTSALISANNIISAYSFNGVATDLNTSNANDLTASGSAVATNADSPFGGQAGGTISATLDYGIISKVTSSVITVNMAEGCTLPTSGGVSSLSYSTYKSPFGFPSQTAKWTIQSINKQLISQSSPTTGVWYNINGFSLNIPIGEWNAGYTASAQINRSSGAGDHRVTLSTTSSSETDAEFTASVSSAPVTDSGSSHYKKKGVSNSASTPYYLNLMTPSAALSTLYLSGDRSPTVVFAENAYL